MGKVINGVDLDSINEEDQLQELVSDSATPFNWRASFFQLDKTKDFDDRKSIIDRMRQLREVVKGNRRWGSSETRF